MIIINLKLITNLYSRYYYYPHFAVEETEAESEKLALCPTEPGLRVRPGTKQWLLTTTPYASDPEISVG